MDKVKDLLLTWYAVISRQKNTISSIHKTSYNLVCLLQTDIRLLTKMVLTKYKKYSVKISDWLISYVMRGVSEFFFVVDYELSVKGYFILVLIVALLVLVCFHLPPKDPNM